MSERAEPGNPHNDSSPLLMMEDLFFGISQILKEHSSCIQVNLGIVMRNLEYKCFVYRNDSDTQIKLILNVRDMLNSMGIDVEIPDIILAKERYLNELASPISDTSDMDCTIDTSGIPSQLYPYELLSTDDPKSDDGNAELFHAIMDDQAVNGIPISDVYDFTRHYLQKIFSHVSYAQRNSAERRKSPYGTMD